MASETVQGPPPKASGHGAQPPAADLSEAGRAAQEGFSSKQMGGREPNVAQRYRMMWSLLARHEETPRAAGAQRVNQCQSLLRRAGEALRQQEWTGQEYDAVWSDLHEARHLLCTLTDQEGLLEIIHDVRSDAAYVPIEVESGDFYGRIERVEALLLEGKHIEQARLQLRHLSARTARSRESMWRRAHRIEDRIRHLRGPLLVGVLLAAALVPGHLQGWPWLPERARGWGDLLVLMFAGAFGSLVNMVREPDATDASAIDFHLRKVRRWIRPLIAAAIVLILYMIARAGVLQLPVADDTPRPALYWTFAFFAGFLDATVLGQLERLGHRAIGSLGEPPSRREDPAHAPRGGNGAPSGHGASPAASPPSESEKSQS